MISIFSFQLSKFAEVISPFYFQLSEF